MLKTYGVIRQFIDTSTNMSSYLSKPDMWQIFDIAPDAPTSPAAQFQKMERAYQSSNLHSY